MKILGIETSCDETAVAVLEAKRNKLKVLSNIVSSQVKLHARYGGVVPNLAAREHAKNIESVFKLALRKARVRNFSKEIDIIAVTRGPGLGPSLLVGIAFARTLAWKYDKPLVGVNHLEGHIYSNWLSSEGVSTSLTPFRPRSQRSLRSLLAPASPTFPILNLIVSGGHTELVLMEGHGKYKIIGETLDDAAGEAFDKVARLLGLGYPGGPEISKAAEKGNPDTYPLPSPMIKLKNYNFSYAGLKTAVLYLVRGLGGKLNLKTKRDIAASFQKAATDVLIKKALRAALEYKVDSIMLSGGVSANTLLRSKFKTLTKENKLRYSRPSLTYTGDNAAMITVAGYFNYTKNKKINTAYDAVEMDANLGF